MSEVEPNITLQDLAAAVKIIDIACSRGAIQGEEMSAVGEIRGNLDAFVKYTQKKNEEMAELENGADNPTGDE